MIKIKNKNLKIILGSSTLLTICLMIIIIAVLMILDFFGGEINTTGYVENNIEYADKYLVALNENLTKELNGYVPLERIIQFYLEDEELDFSSIYKNNLDLENKKMLDISTVCKKSYSTFSICKDKQNLYEDEFYRPFNSPMVLSKTTITSFYGQERIVFGEYDIHYAYDLASPAQTPIYSVGDGEVVTVRFNQDTNTTDTKNGLGNYIITKHEVNSKDIFVTYAHLFPNSSKVKVGDIVSHKQLIATVGTTGYSTGNHLHFEVTIDGKAIDGFDLINFNFEDS